MPWGALAAFLILAVAVPSSPPHCSVRAETLSQAQTQTAEEGPRNSDVVCCSELDLATGLDADEACHLMQRRQLKRSRLQLSANSSPTATATSSPTATSTSTSTTAPEAEKKAEEEAKSAVKKAAEVAGSSKKGAPQVEEAKQNAIKKVVAVEPAHRWNIWRTVFKERQAERRHTMVSCSLLPFGTMIVASSLPVGFLTRHVRRNDAPECSRSIYLVLAFVLTLNYAIVILDSYDFCTTLGLSQATSGRMVGTYMLGAALGAAAVWVLQRCRRELWKEAPRAPLLVGLLFQLVGAVLYCWVSMKGTDAAGKSADLPLSIATLLFGLGDKPFLSQTLMLSRFLMGIGSGSCQQFFVSSMLHVTPVAERTEHTSKWVFSGMIALGAGPLVAASLQALDLCKRWPRYDLVGYAQVFSVFTALASAAMLPSLDNVTDCLQQEEQNEDAPPFEEGGQDQSQTGSPTLVVGSLAMTGLRSYSVAAIEVALALKLEQTYDWDQRVTGLVTGGVFLCCIPTKIIHSVWGSSFTVLGWIRLFSCLSITGSMLLFSRACDVLLLSSGDLCSYVLIASGVVLFPCLYMSDALCTSLMHQHVLPEGSLLDANHVQLWFMVSIGVGRFTGPWLARLTLQRMGQDAFAVEQLAVTVLFLLAFEVVVKPCVSPRVLTIIKQQ